MAKSKGPLDMSLMGDEMDDMDEEPVAASIDSATESIMRAVTSKDTVALKSALNRFLDARESSASEEE